MTEPTRNDPGPIDPRAGDDLAGRQWRPGTGFVAAAAVLAAILAGVAAAYAHDNADNTAALRAAIAARPDTAAPHTMIFQANSGAHDAVIADAAGVHHDQPLGTPVTDVGVVLVEVVAVANGRSGVSCSITVDGAVVDHETAPAGLASFTVCTWGPTGPHP